MRAPRGGLAGALRPAWVEIDLDAVEANMALLRRRVAPARVLAVLKADAYGHGAPRAARALAAAGVDWLGVALLEEGAELRRAAVTLPILVLGTAQESQVPLYRRYRLTPTVSSLEQLSLWCREAVRSPPSQPIYVHLKIDTGMHRLGIAPDELGEALDRLRRTPGLRLAGLASHFADADRPESRRNDEQERLFEDLLRALEPAERERAVIHLANSSAALRRPASRYGLVRLGLGLWGVDPAGTDSEIAAALRPAMSVVARVVQRRRIEAGATVGYGSRWQAARPSVLAVVPIGYADGYPWRLGGLSTGASSAEALLGGRRVPLAGAVSMDMLTLDVTAVEAAADGAVPVGEEVVLLGRQRDEEVPAWELARRAGTVPYEILCAFGLRLPRRYWHRGRWDEQSRRFSRSRT